LTFRHFISSLQTTPKPVNGGQGETVTFWDPENGADEDSVPAFAMSNNLGFYNWFAATAGSGSASMIDAVAPDSICPSGWTLPNHNATLSYKTSIGYYLSNYTEKEELAKLERLPLSIGFYGAYNFAMGVNTASGIYGHLLTKHSYSNTNVHHFFISSLSSANSQAGTSKLDGNMVRCTKE